MSNRLALALAVLVSTSACTTGGRVLIGAGLATSAVGGAMLIGTGRSDTTIGDTGIREPVSSSVNHAAMGVSTGFVIAGLAMALVGVMATRYESDDDEPVTDGSMASNRSSVVVTGAPGSGDAAHVKLASPAELALRTRLENRLAIQASFTARRGDCVAAVATSNRLATVDPAMHAELMRSDENLATCVAVVAAARR